MKKDTLCEIYDILDDNTSLLTNLLFRIKNIKGKSENVFYFLVKNHKELINNDTIEVFIDLSIALGSIEDDILLESIMVNINELLENDVITSSVDFNEIIVAIIFTLNYEYEKIFYCFEEGSIDYYRVLVSEYLIEIFNNLKKVDIDKVYNHSFLNILDAFANVLQDLDNTDVKENILTDEYDVNNTFLKRIKTFSELISNKVVYELNDNKYNSILEITSTITDVKKISEFKGMIIFNRKLNNKEFIKLLDELIDEVNDITIKRINDKLGIKKRYDADEDIVIIERENEHIDEKNIVKKILKTEKNY